MRRGRDRSGITLGELLVVIVVIAVLAAILFPVLARWRDRARATSCLSNTKQIGAALAMYLQDYDRTFPFANDFGSPPFNLGRSPIQTGFLYWGDLLFPYLQDAGGSARTAARAVGDYGPVQRCPAAPGWYTGYAYNINLGYFPNGQLGVVSESPIYRGVKLASLPHPADLIAVLDSSVPYAWMRNNLEYSHRRAHALAYRWFPVPPPLCMKWYNWPESARSAGKPGTGAVSGRHQGGVNCLFADGHARWMRTGDDLCRLERGYPEAPQSRLWSRRILAGAQKLRVGRRSKACGWN